MQIEVTNPEAMLSFVIRNIVRQELRAMLTTDEQAAEPTPAKARRVRRLPGGHIEPKPKPAAPRRRGRMTPEGRKRISELMIKRWAQAKKARRNHL